MSRHAIAAGAALLALTACSAPATPAPATTSTPASTTTSGKAHRILYTLFGLPTTMTYTGDSGTKHTTSNPQPPIIEHATLHDGDTAEITATGDNPATGLGCSISVDNIQVTKQTSFDATTEVTCTYTVR